MTEIENDNKALLIIFLVGVGMLLLAYFAVEQPNFKFMFGALGGATIMMVIMMKAYSHRIDQQVEK